MRNASGQYNRIKLTLTEANATLRADRLVDKMGLLALPADRLDRAILQTDHAAGAFFSIDGIGQERPAHLGRTLFMTDMGLILVPEIPDGGQNRVWRRLPETAK